MILKGNVETAANFVRESVQFEVAAILTVLSNTFASKNWSHAPCHAKCHVSLIPLNPPSMWRNANFKYWRSLPTLAYIQISRSISTKRTETYRHFDQVHTSFETIGLDPAPRSTRTRSSCHILLCVTSFSSQTPPPPPVMFNKLSRKFSPKCAFALLGIYLGSAWRRTSDHHFDNCLRND